MLTRRLPVLILTCGLLLPASGSNALQQAVTRAMAGRPGAALVAEVRTGRLLAVGGLKPAAERLAAPGSVIKPFVLWALVETGNLESGSALPCPRQLRIRGRRLDCTHPAVSIPLDPATALAYSCNAYFARMALRLDAARFAKSLREAGLASVTGLVPGERSGRIRQAADQEELQLQALGEAAIEVTPLGLMNAYRRLAMLRLSDARRLAPLFEGLEAAVEYGTARQAQPAGIKVAGKTGTSAAGHAWFAGYAPAQRPAIVVVIFLEGGRGGSDAAPLARRIFEAYGGLQTASRQVRVKLRGRADLVPLSLEDYTVAVLAGECPNFTSDEALKAMAVTVRTWAVRHRGRHRAEGFDFCDTTHCQYLRLDSASEKLRAAAAATEGELLWYEGAPAAAFHHANCGGMTEAGASVWPQFDAPYLPSAEDFYCTRSGRAAWRAEVRKQDLASALGLHGPLTLEVLKRTASGRVGELSVAGRRFTAEQFSSAVGRALGWHLLKSNWYEPADAGDRVVFRGYGAGHGVGLCQAGAEERGRQGHGYRQILAHYFPGTVLGVSARGFAWTRMAGERVNVWSTRPSQDARLVSLADRALEEAERRTGLTVRTRPQLRVYPTVAAFRDATGEAGWVAASTLAGVIRLQPAGVLGANLAPVLLHEMLHVVLEEDAHPNAPLWLREELADFLGGNERGQVAELVRKHGLAAVLGWLRRGVPP